MEGALATLKGEKRPQVSWDEGLQNFTMSALLTNLIATWASMPKLNTAIPVFCPYDYNMHLPEGNGSQNHFSSCPLKIASSPSNNTFTDSHSGTTLFILEQYFLNPEWRQGRVQNFQAHKMVIVKEGGTQPSRKITGHSDQ